jgi:hypothetical protein
LARYARRALKNLSRFRVVYNLRYLILKVIIMSKSSASKESFQFDLRQVGENRFVLSVVGQSYVATFDGDPDTIVNDLNIIAGIYHHTPRAERDVPLAAMCECILCNPELLQEVRTLFRQLQTTDVLLAGNPPSKKTSLH